MPRPPDCRSASRAASDVAWTTLNARHACSRFLRLCAAAHSHYNRLFADSLRTGKRDAATICNSSSVFGSTSSWLFSNSYALCARLICWAITRVFPNAT